MARLPKALRRIVDDFEKAVERRTFIQSAPERDRPFIILDYKNTKLVLENTLRELDRTARSSGNVQS